MFDPEFGELKVRFYAQSRHIRFFIDPTGVLAVSAPKHTRLSAIKRLLETNREAIKKTLPLKRPQSARVTNAKVKLLRKSAKAYLPYRLAFFAQKYGYQYKGLRLSHARTRWGSRSSSGLISLNIGLMQLPPVLRDYVILHELAHINHMDHSPAFWAEVALHDPDYRRHRRLLKNFSPNLN